MAARVASLDMAAQGRRAADFDGAHHPQLGAAERAGVGLPVGNAVVADDVRHLQFGAGHGRAAAAGRGPGGQAD